ncbi:hypothetical protein ACTU6U_10650 [Microbacterium sp. A196]|uniref:hypothetical protein n=1 Tax=unclassified Microbacterium TaxID=2609290 RepID=UPI003FD485ED
MSGSDQPTSPESNEPPPADETPDTEDMQEPSTEKEPAEEPKAPPREEPEPSHEAVGIGIIGRPQVEPEVVEDAEEAADDAS